MAGSSPPFSPPLPPLQFLPFNGGPEVSLRENCRTKNVCRRVLEHSRRKHRHIYLPGNSPLTSLFLPHAYPPPEDFRDAFCVAGGAFERPWNCLNTWSMIPPYTAYRLLLKPKFHLARHVTSRHVRDKRVEPCCSNMADDEQAIVLACTSLVVFMLLRTQILFVLSNKIN